MRGQESGTYDRRKFENQRSYSSFFLCVSLQTIEINYRISLDPTSIELVLWYFERESLWQEVTFERAFFRTDISELNEEVDGGSVRLNFVFE